jgi:hypothetical protein
VKRNSLPSAVGLAERTSLEQRIAWLEREMVRMLYGVIGAVSLLAGGVAYLLSALDRIIMVDQRQFSIGQLEETPSVGTPGWRRDATHRSSIMENGDGLATVE